MNIRKRTLTGEVIDLNWLCYPETKGKVYEEFVQISHLTYMVIL